MITHVFEVDPFLVFFGHSWSTKSSTFCSAQSTEMNAARLQVLKARDGVLREVYEEAGKQLTKLANDDPERYSELVKDAIFQGLVKLGDNEVLVRCRKKDLKTVEGMLPDISDSYTSKTGKSLKVEVDKKTFLSENSAGGVTLLSEYGRIVVENTFESRLEIAYQQNLPQIRQILFQEQDKESSN